MTDKKNNTSPTSENFEADLYEALKFYGDDLPETDEEIRAFIKTIGETKIELPSSLSDPVNLFKKIISSSSKTHSNVPSAMAAHGQNETELPDHIEEKLKRDIKNGKRIVPSSDNGSQKKK
jgi:hypothetical protein